MGIGKPRMQGRQTHLRAVTDKQKDKGEAYERCVELRRNLHKPAPGHGRNAFTENALSRKINDDRTEKCERDAEDEILPGRLERGWGPVDTDHDNGHQRGEFQAYPLARLDLVLDVAPAEHRRSEADE